VAIICRMLELPAEPASELQANAARLPDVMKAAKVYSDVYRYWHAIEYLLTRHAPTAPMARWLGLGATVSVASSEIPAARLIPPSEVTELDRLLQGIQPEQLVPGYDAAGLDAADVYPGTWREWEETFDPLGQVLEHYSFLQSRARSCAEAGNSLLLVFEELADGTV
jgi:uncharacterized protein DUF1877